ncbi:phosphatase PAP2 family protein [Streptomyces sp. UH6]|uniref:phosphatase PAP2 family protein n=1 Tax=Streptomyces sp. UH6 TaxID=2748379 RepID=UPI0015D4BEF8|nr:phosphatase PAP2 family protein [Streptomyces sp. UH6]NYV78247.1 phosphatase PAP2 family protein [Streptomyces sp. UH6]
MTALEGRPRQADSGTVAGADVRPGRLRRLRTPRRPRIWFEILLIGASYWTYSLIRNAVPEQRAVALRNADWLWDVENRLGLAVEETVNHAVNSVEWLIVGMNYYYATLHFVVTLGVLVWLFRSRPALYSGARTVLFATTAVALVGYYLFPLAPPRLMNGSGFVDTVLVHGTWGSMASGDLKHMSNQYAAMPSMHIGWSVWSGLTIYALARVPWVRVLALLYPVATLVVIVATANHFWLDAVGGLICLAFGWTVARLWYGPASVPGPFRRTAAAPPALPRPSGGPAPSAPHGPAAPGPARAGEEPSSARSEDGPESSVPREPALPRNPHP